jgi:hypothetical protein
MVPSAHAPRILRNISRNQVAVRIITRSLQGRSTSSWSVSHPSYPRSWQVTPTCSRRSSKPSRQPLYRTTQRPLSPSLLTRNISLLCVYRGTIRGWSGTRCWGGAPSGRRPGRIMITLVTLGGSRCHGALNLTSSATWSTRIYTLILSSWQIILRITCLWRRSRSSSRTWRTTH